MTTSADTLDDLDGYIRLNDVVLYEVSARRRDGFDASSMPASRSNHEMRVLHQANEESIRVRCRLEAATSDGVYAIDAAAIFGLSTPVELAPELAQEFVRSVGLPAVYPYLRTELQMAARRLGLKAPVLELLRPERLKR